MVIVLRPVYFNAAVLDRSSPRLLPFIKICVQCYIFVGIIQTCLNFLTDPELILCTFLCATTIGTVCALMAKRLYTYDDIMNLPDFIRVELLDGIIYTDDFTDLEIDEEVFQNPPSEEHHVTYRLSIVKK